VKYVSDGFNPNVWLAEHAEDLGVAKKTLLVLASNNDPFNCGSPAQLEAAMWFARVYERVGLSGHTPTKVTLPSLRRRAGDPRRTDIPQY